MTYIYRAQRVVVKDRALIYYVDREGDIHISGAESGCKTDSSSCESNGGLAIGE